MQLLGTCSELLVVLLQHHGIQTQENEGIVTIPDGPPYQFALPVFKGGEKTVELQALCQVAPGRVIREYLAGVGETQEEAVMDSQTNFIACVFHVWVSALLGKPNQYADDFTWQIHGKERRATVGFASGRGYIELTGEPEWQEAWHAAVRQQPLTEDLHWASLCYVQRDGVTLACDASIDNEPCVPVIEQMLKFNWPSRKEMYSVRQFMIIQP